MGVDDPSLTGSGGPLLSRDLTQRLGLIGGVDAADNAVRSFKRRRRGRSVGELLVALADWVLVGSVPLAHLEVLRQDLAGASLRAAVPVLVACGQG